MSFKEFVDKKGRTAKKELGILKRVLEKDGLMVGDFLEDDDPYIYVRTPSGTLSFDGIRIYKIGNSIAYRIQKEEKTHPYGKAYSMDIEDMFHDLLSDKMDEEKAGHKVMEGLVQELKSFFEKSADAEKELQSDEFEKSKDPLGRVMVKSTGTDYSNQVHSKGN